MTEPNFPYWIQQLASDNSTECITAQLWLLDRDEDAIEPLADAYYAGVNDTLGVAILKIMAEIGGWEALAILRNIFQFEEERLAFKQAAAQGLMHNRDNLSHDEIRIYDQYLSRIR